MRSAGKVGWEGSMSSQHDGAHALHPLPVTHWSLVSRAGREDSAVRREALTELLGQYLAPMRSHLVVRKRIDSDRADDLVQGFIATRVLDSELLASADRGRGRFRTYLLTALDRYVLNQARHDRAKKRSAEGGAAPIDAVPEPVSGEAPPDRTFEIAWARSIVAQAIARMEAECVALARADVWGVFQDRVLGPLLHGAEPMPYAAMVERFGFASPAQASNVLVTGKRTFARALRAVVLQYERDETDVDEEIADLLRALGS
jgi:DNA-directed RNA polymerase specialized sigma24 family protein